MTTANTSPAETRPLEALVREWLAGRAHVHELRVIVEEEGVVLEGRAASYYAKQLAQHAALVVSGLPLRTNRIEVRGGAS
jgi:hypothetical protein